MTRPTAVERHLAVAFGVGLAMAIIFMLGIQLGIHKGRSMERAEILSAPTMVQDDGQAWACMPWTEYDELMKRQVD